jgi:serine/threonine-protein kinase
VSLSDAAVRRLQGVLSDPTPPGGRYEVGAVVGQGGMGTVYRASDRLLEREVALKVLRADVAAPEAAARISREARILARLEHPGIVPVHDVGTLPDGRVYYVMKLVRGEPLEAVVRGASLPETLRLFLRACETVAFAHANGVIHRDLKPSNIMVGAFGEVLVLDWGIARVLADPEAARPPAVPTDLDDRPVGDDTAPGTILGTPGFMAPEQAQSWLDLVSPRTDVFALGAILRHLVELAARGEGLPRPLTSIWGKAMQIEPADRYPTATDLAAEVTRFLDGEPVHAHRETLAERAGACSDGTRRPSSSC